MIRFSGPIILNKYLYLLTGYCTTLGDRCYSYKDLLDAVDKWIGSHIKLEKPISYYKFDEIQTIDPNVDVCLVRLEHNDELDNTHYDYMWVELPKEAYINELIDNSDVILKTTKDDPKLIEMAMEIIRSNRKRDKDELLFSENLADLEVQEEGSNPEGVDLKV